jgi:hypothetical protein
MTVSGQESKSPSVAELQKFVRDKVKLEFLLSNGEKFVGTLRWFDDNCFSLIQEYEGPITLVRTSVLGYRVMK